MDRSHNGKGFTLIELLMLLSLVALAIGLIWPMFDRGKPSRIFKNEYQIHQIQLAFMQYAEGNSNFYPGLSRSSKRSDGLIDAVDIDNAIDNSSASHSRFQMLLNSDLIPPEYLLAPVEDRRPWPGKGNTLNHEHTSYALLNINNPETDKHRRAEWTTTFNYDAVIISDRALSVNENYTLIKKKDDGKIRSIWSNYGKLSPDSWYGIVGFNDGHVSREWSHIIGITQYGETTNQNDNLFRYDDTPDTSANAFLIWGKGVDTSE